MTSSSPAWRYAYSSVRGTSHVAQDKPCQDAVYCKVHIDSGDHPVLVAIVSDGAGSAARSDDGSREVCRMLVSEIEQHFRTDDSTLGQIDTDFFKNFLTYFRNEMSRLAAADEGTVSDFACTLLVALVGENQAVLAQLGDGAIVYSLAGDCDRYQLGFLPAHGEYVNVTHFVTEADSEQNLQYEFLPDCIGELAVFSDGIERLALNLQTMQPHLPFFRPMLTPIRNTEEEGMHSHLSHALTNFLDSDAVNSRSDDDKTLILASRCLEGTSQKGLQHDDDNRPTV